MSVTSDAAEMRLDQRDRSAREYAQDPLHNVALEASAAGINPEEVLRHANERFRDAFQRLEGLAWDTGSSLQDLPVEQRTALWHRAWHEAEG